MTKPTETRSERATPEKLNGLRTAVLDWTERARTAVLGYHRDDGSFFLNSRTAGSSSEGLSETTTSRCYMALAAADRALGAKGPPEWAGSLREFVENTARARLEKQGKRILVRKESASSKPQPLSTFEIAHLADVIYAGNFVNRFSPHQLIQPVPVLRDEVRGYIDRALESGGTSQLGSDGALAFQREKNWVGHHHFVTLHSLRALSILGEDRRHPELEGAVRRFCLEQCFYAHRSRHEHDVFRLAFAGVVYILYANELDRDLAASIVEAIASAQQADGRWPATHPIVLRQRPWYITSHEISLCLTWLYFQRQLGDTTRFLILDVLESYFRNWVTKSFTTTTVCTGSDQRLQGWSDDHRMEDDFTEGWATGIVCHFLGNYCDVLDNHINRRVIEELDLGETALYFHIEDVQHKPSPRWAPKPGVVWPDLPPYSWKEPPADLAREITWQWTDPSPKSAHSRNLAEKVLRPIFESGRPDTARTSAVLTGDPGTRKTTLVKTLSKVLGWPYVPVPSSVLFTSGFDRMEERAPEVFRMLGYLRGCVLFFDEWEEVFRRRSALEAEKPRSGDKATSREGADRQADGSAQDASANGPTHDRTIAAFTTAAMLPRLQDLHDVGSCLIFLATNYVDQIDEAVLRPGRLDFMLKIKHPTVDRLKECLRDPKQMTRRTLRDSMLLELDRNGKTAKDASRFAAIAEPVLEALESGDAQFSMMEEALVAVARMATASSSVQRDGMKQRASEAIDQWRRLRAAGTTPSLVDS